MTSIRYRLVWRLLGLSNEVSKRCMEYLNRHKVHSQAGVNVDNRFVLEIYRSRSEGDVYGNSINDPALRDKIGKHYAGIAVANIPLNAAQFSNLPGLNNNFVVTHDGPLFPSDLNSPRSVQYGPESSTPASPKRTRKAEAAS